MPTRSDVVIASLLAVVLATAARAESGYMEPAPGECSDTAGDCGPCACRFWLTDPCTGSFVEDRLYSPEQCLTCQYVDIFSFICPIVSTPDPPCSNEIRKLEFGVGPNTVISWDRRPCVGPYDVIRGEMPTDQVGGPFDSVTCLANDVPQPTFPGATPIAGPIDSVVPPAGHFFFYLIRAGGSTYGYGRGSNGTERVPTNGDCAQ
jgi:hypothetical protein